VICPRLLPLVLVVLLPACGLHSPLPSPTSTGRVQTVAAPIDRTWSALSKVYQSAGFPVDEVEASEHRVWSTTTLPLWEVLYGGQDAHPVRCTLPEIPRALLFAANLDDPRARILPVYDRGVRGTIMISVATELRGEGSLTKVITELRAAPVAESMTSEPGLAVQCASTGVWEARVVDGLTAELGI
jgi:hypothetical protein